MSDISSVITKMKSFHARKSAQLNEIESVEKNLILNLIKIIKNV